MILPLITILLLRVPQVQRIFVLFIILADIPLMLSLTIGSSLMVAILVRYVKTKRKLSHWTPPGGSDNTDRSKGTTSTTRSGPTRTMSTVRSKPKPKKQGIYDRWLMVRFTVAFVVLGIFDITNTLFQLTAAQNNRHDLGSTTPDLTAARANSTLFLFMPGITPGIALFLIFGTTAGHRAKMYETFVPRRWQKPPGERGWRLPKPRLPKKSQWQLRPRLPRGYWRKISGGGGPARRGGTPELLPVVAPTATPATPAVTVTAPAAERRGDAPTTRSVPTLMKPLPPVRVRRSPTPSAAVASLRSVFNPRSPPRNANANANPNAGARSGSRPPRRPAAEEEEEEWDEALFSPAAGPSSRGNNCHQMRDVEAAAGDLRDLRRDMKGQQYYDRRDDDDPELSDDSGPVLPIMRSDTNESMVSKETVESSSYLGR
ncbi:hypothetical protein GGR56DRAFT_679322 [Xylariaceae sp. FL0804]|nr:hypothetical protein GGR56DRAFT_679322 [Xylariaceae sp. FL0804]